MDNEKVEHWLSNHANISNKAVGIRSSWIMRFSCQSFCNRVYNLQMNFFLFKACSFLILITELPPKGKVTKNLISHLLVSVISTRFEV